MAAGPGLGRGRPGRPALLDHPERRGRDGELKTPSRNPAQRVERHRSAGGLVVHGSQVLLISTQEGRRWQLPKGHIEPGEAPEETAVREVREETGVTGRVVAVLPGVDYWFAERGGRRIHKTVDYFLLEYVSGSTADFDPGEVSGAGWFTWDEAIERISFDNERRVLEAARKLVAPAPPTAAGGSSE